MERIYHTWDKWECFPAGLYEQTAPRKMTAVEANGAYAMFLKDSARFSKALERVLIEWPSSCEHYLSNEKMNRIAWLGQAAMCIDTGISNNFRSGFNLLSTAQQNEANEVALVALNQWLVTHGEQAVDMAGAGVNCIAEQY